MDINATMKLKYKLRFSDFLEYQLYASSKSKLHKKNRKKIRIIVPVIYFAIASLLSYINFVNQAIVIFGIAILWYLFYPLYSKWKYRKHFKNHVKENYKNRIGKELSIDFHENADFLETYDSGAETKIKYSEFDKLIEIREHYFLRLKSGLSFIIPKREVIDHEKFKKLFSDLNLEYSDESNWKWK